MANHKKYFLGLPLLPIFILALLGVPRVTVYDLHLVVPGSLINSFLVFIPPIIWLGFVLWKTDKTFKPLLFIGIFYGILLGITHQIL